MRIGAQPSFLIVGAGIIGCCAAYHLLRTGETKVTVVDVHEPGGGTTSAGAGFVSHWSAGMASQMGEEGYFLQDYGLDFYKRLHSLGPDTGYRPTGTLMMALTEQGFETHVAPVLRSPLSPPEMRHLGPAEIGEIMGGLVDPAEVYGAALNPLGIQIETGRAIKVLAGEIRRLGGDIRTGVTVTALHDLDDHVRVATDAGSFEADKVILAAGAWNNRLLGGLGWQMPLLRMLATRIVTDDRGLASTLPTVQCRELKLWLRESNGGITWGSVDGYAPLHRLQANSDLPPGKPNHPEMIERLLARQQKDLEKIFPPLRGSRIASWSQGIPCYTPDGDLMLGPVPGISNILAAGGDNETGVTHGPGMGRLLAELALGQPTFVDTRRYRLDRLDPEDYPDEAAVEAAVSAIAVERPMALEPTRTN